LQATLSKVITWEDRFAIAPWGVGLSGPGRSFFGRRLVGLFVALPAVIFVFSLNVSSVQARRAGTIYGASLGGAAVSFGMGSGMP
tara:strand:+ start:221 stop:475 length:255 start_codon:yes stop_codon:yes gene_type:complete